MIVHASCMYVYFIIIIILLIIESRCVESEREKTHTTVVVRSVEFQECFR